MRPNFEKALQQTERLGAGFGSLCIIPQLLFSFLLSEALMGMAFPLFVLMACESDPRAQYQKGEHPERQTSLFQLSFMNTHQMCLSMFCSAL